MTTDVTASVALRTALKEQYHGGLAMLRQSIERCPDALWAGGTYPRLTWRIAFHTLFYTHLYLGQREEDYRPWEHARDAACLWEDPPAVPEFTQAELLDYCDHLDSLIDATVDGLDLDADSGFGWYPGITKLSHQLMNLRHLQGHVGQISELLMAEGIDIDWVSRR